MRFSWKRALQLVYIVDDRDGLLLFEEPYDVVAARMLACHHSDERDSGGAGAAGVVYRIAEIPDRLSGERGLNREQTFGMRLRIGHVIRADDGIEGARAGEAIECNVGFIAQT